MKKLTILLTLLVCCFSYFGCSALTENIYTPTLVLQGYIYANEPIDSILVRQTIAIEDTSRNSDFVTGASVQITVDGKSYTLSEKQRVARPGRYTPDETIIAIPGKTYKLTVSAYGSTAWSETTVPEPIQLDSVRVGDRKLSLTAMDTVQFPKDESELNKPGVQLWWTSSKSAAGYSLEAVSFDTTQKLINLDSARNNLPDTVSRGRYRFFIISNTEQLSWLQFKYYGPNTVRALALDHNFQDMILGLYLNGSQFNNNTLHVNGGLGIFGSAARASKEVYLKE